MVEVMTNEQMIEELLPCPFCGNSDYLCVSNGIFNSGQKTYYVECPECAACSGSFLLSQDEAIKAWNTRAMQPYVKELVEALSMVDRLTEYGDGDVILKGSAADKIIEKALASLPKEWSNWVEGGGIGYDDR
jgi:Lar family restriction alleviation protein